ncbi:MAG: hypothetical protein KC731_20490 [Myxococcales bacterium]|nr:hypothetical protein [Myxococcales bacterium]
MSPSEPIAEPQVKAKPWTPLRPIGHKLILAVAFGLAVFCLAWVGELGVKALPMSLLWAAVLWLYLASVLFLLARAAMAYFRCAPALPVLSTAAAQGKPLLVGAAAFVLLVSAAREGAFALAIRWLTTSRPTKGAPGRSTCSSKDSSCPTDGRMPKGMRAVSPSQSLR